MSLSFSPNQKPMNRQEQMQFGLRKFAYEQQLKISQRAKTEALKNL